MVHLALSEIHCTAVSFDGLTGIEVVDSEVVRVIFIGTIELTMRRYVADSEYQYALTHDKIFMLFVRMGGFNRITALCPSFGSKCFRFN